MNVGNVLLTLVVCSSTLAISSGYTVTAYWDTCQSKDIRIEISGYAPNSVAINFAVRKATAAAPAIPYSTIMSASAGTTKYSDITSVSDSKVSYKIYWHDNNDVQTNGVILVTRCANGVGEPHFSTLDGAKYDFQGYCSYTLLRDECQMVNTPLFAITADLRARNPRFPYRPPTTIVNINVYVKGELLVKLLEDNSFEIDGKHMNNTSAVLAHGIGTIDIEDGICAVRLTEPSMSITWDGKPHKVMIALNNDNLEVCGLLGNNDGNPDNDFQKPNGDLASGPNEFGDSWEIPQSCP